MLFKKILFRLKSLKSTGSIFMKFSLSDLRQSTTIIVNNIFMYRILLLTFALFSAFDVIMCLGNVFFLN